MSADTEPDYDREYHGDGDESEGWDLKLAVGLIVVGAVLLLFPEPFTSVVGLFMIIGGVVFAVIEEFGEYLADR